MDLPDGYRWASEIECELYTVDPRSIPNALIVPRTVDSTGRPYTNGEADIAVPAKEF